MSARPHELLRVQAHAFNARDLDTLVGHYTAAVRFIRDGQLVGEGRDGARKALEQEAQAAVARVVEIDGEAVLVEYSGDEGREQPRGVIRFEAMGDMITECRVDHSARALASLQDR